MSIESVVVQDARLDPDHFLLDRVDTSAGPHFSVSQVGKIFFARTAFWIRWLEDGHRTILDGDPACPHFTPSTRIIEVITAEGEQTREVKSKDSWLVDGVCSRCGGRQVGVTKTKTGSRIYTLTDVEEVVHALAGAGAISGAQATNALHLVQTMARIHGLLA